MNVYPYNTALILTDSIFLAYGGQTGTMTAAQRSVAYLIAEKQASNYIGTFLLPTIVTGTFTYGGSRFIATDYGYVHRVLSAKVLYIDDTTTCELEEETGCVLIREDTFGYLDFFCILSACGCGGAPRGYKYQIVYEAGLPTGTANQPDILLGLTMASQITLNEMVFPSANEGVGDVGIEEFRTLDYSEKRKTLKRTAFGSSAKANKVAQLFDNAVKKARQAIIL